MCDAQFSEVMYIERKGGTVLLYGGYQFYKLKAYKNGYTNWRCSLFKKQKCTGSVTVQDKKMLKMKTHTCQPDYGKNEIAITISNLKKTVTESNQPIPMLYKKAFKKVKDDGVNLVTNVPTFTSVQHSLYDMRNRYANVNKTVFKNVEDVHIPIDYYSFVLADYYYQGNRILIFCSNAAKKRIVNFLEYFGDGTFYACPPPFTQLFSIHGDVGSTTDTTNVQPLIFALLMDKKQSTYELMFALIKSQLPNFEPKYFHCDFEVAILNAISKTFPEAQIVGCYYHWHRCIWKKAKALKCVNKPENRIVRLVAALPLLPAEKILEGFKYIRAESKGFEISEFVQYVERNWINKNKVEIISVFGKRHRTNNVLESWHGKINKILKKSTVTIMRLLETLEAESKSEIADKITNKRRKQYIKIDDNIRRIQMQLINNEITLELAIEKLS